ncbi:hypothetical protein EB619_25030 [Escherichia coli]|nr:hypothetical protein [Escherichia coli]
MKVSALEKQNSGTIAMKESTKKDWLPHYRRFLPPPNFKLTLVFGDFTMPTNLRRLFKQAAKALRLSNG